MVVGVHGLDLPRFIVILLLPVACSGRGRSISALYSPVRACVSAHACVFLSGVFGSFIIFCRSSFSFNSFVVVPLYHNTFHSPNQPIILLFTTPTSKNFKKQKHPTHLKQQPQQTTAPPPKKTPPSSSPPRSSLPGRASLATVAERRLTEEQIRNQHVPATIPSLSSSSSSGGGGAMRPSSGGRPSAGGARGVGGGSFLDHALAESTAV